MNVPDRLELDGRTDVLDEEGRRDGYPQTAGCDKARDVLQGIGLGLSIAGSVVKDLYDGALRLLSPGTLGGAGFRVRLRRRIARRRRACPSIGFSWSTTSPA